MNKIGLIVSREYITRVRKKSFLIMTLIGPVLFAALIVLPGWLATIEDREVQEIAVVECDVNGQPVPDSLQFFRDVIPNKENIAFTYLTGMKLQDILKAYEATDYDGVLFLPQNLISSGREAYVEFYYRKPPSMGMEVHIARSIEDFLFSNKLIVKNIPADVIQSLETKISLNRINWKSWPAQHEDTTDVKRGLGYVGGFLIYIFIFMFGAQVMRGVLEEKTSRIVEVIISSVSPFQLMMGKIIGIGLIGLTQFVAWLILTIGISAFAQQVILPKPAAISMEQVVPADIMNQDASVVQPVINNGNKQEAAMMLSGIIKQLGQINIFLVIGAFIFYFLGGYILYGSLFAAIGAAVDNETDTQQFMFPITIPLILGLFVMINSFINPSGKLAVWFSIIPLTSPIVMMARIPFEVPVGQLLASGALLIITFLGTTWLAAKIYRTGILMYGKKVTYGELWKWIWYKG
ncbi:MAG TPA: ABC transporter permease [Bacteroidales bacterium]|nr:ABC transporter permease [Bacteroidales bacterium]